MNIILSPRGKMDGSIYDDLPHCSSGFHPKIHDDGYYSLWCILLQWFPVTTNVSLPCTYAKSFYTMKVGDTDLTNIKISNYSFGRKKERSIQ